MKPIRITAQCKLVTPMLSSGADQTKFELRATSVKSALRFWWRAFHPQDTKELYKEESKLFGNTDRKSAFRISVNYDTEKFKTWEPGQKVMEWGPGMVYFFFPIAKPPVIKKNIPAKIKPVNKKDPQLSGRPVAKPEVNRFEININFLFTKDTRIVGDLICSLWLLENLGGIGGRTRRGAGSFNIDHLTIDDIPLEKARTADEYKQLFELVPRFQIAAEELPENFIKNGLDTILSRWENNNIHFPEYTAFRKGISSVRVLTGPKNMLQQNLGPTDLMELIGRWMQTFRRSSPPEEGKAMYQSIRNAVYGIGKPEPPNLTTIRKAYLGMPIIYNFRDDTGLLKIPGSDKNATFQVSGITDKKESRRASPLFFSYNRKEEKTYLVVSYLPAQLLDPKNNKLRLKASYKDDEIGTVLDPPDDSFARELLQNLDEKFNTVIIYDTTPPTAKVTQKTSNFTSIKKSKTLITKGKRAPEEILQDNKIMSGKILVRLESTVVGKKVIGCTRLYMDKDGKIVEEPGWTVTQKNLKLLGNAKPGDLIIGTENPHLPKRLNNLKKV